MLLAIKRFLVLLSVLPYFSYWLRPYGHGAREVISQC